MIYFVAAGAVLRRAWKESHSDTEHTEKKLTKGSLLLLNSGLVLPNEYICSSQMHSNPISLEKSPTELSEQKAAGQPDLNGPRRRRLDKASDGLVEMRQRDCSSIEEHRSRCGMLLPKNSQTSDGMPNRQANLPELWHEQTPELCRGRLMFCQIRQAVANVQVEAFLFKV